MRRAASLSRGVIRAGAILYSFRLVAGFLVAYPAARAFAAFGAAPFADGDRVLFEPGGVLLVEALRFGARTLASVAGGATVGLFVLSFVGLLPLAAALTGLTRPGASVGRTLEFAFEKLPAFALFFGASWLLRAVYAGAALLLLSGATSLSKGVVDERAADLTVGALGLVLLCGLLVIDCLHDLCRAAVVRFDESPTTAALSALRVGLARPVRVLALGAVPAAVSVALVAIGAALTSVVDVSRPGAWRVAAVFVLHQLVVFGIALARAQWLALALELVGEARFSASDAARTSERGLAVDLNVAPSGPVPGEVEAHDPAP
jgi:hypothetical protein